MTTLISPLVGFHFYPPAKALLSSMPMGTTLILRPEPENPYDSNAVAVYLDPQDIPEESRRAMSEALEGYGLYWEDDPETGDPGLLSEGERKIGHLAAKLPKGATGNYTFCDKIQPLLLHAQEIDHPNSYSAKFSLGDNSLWVVVITLED
jgi:hypothetical protein